MLPVLRLCRVIETPQIGSPEMRGISHSFDVNPLERYCFDG